MKSFRFIPFCRSVAFLSANTLCYVRYAFFKKMDLRRKLNFENKLLIMRKIY